MAEKNRSGMTIPTPSSRAFAITVSDTTNQLASTFPNASDNESISFAVYVATAGAVAVICANDTNAVTFSGVPAGTVLPVLVKRVMSTGTTSTTGLIGLC